jgi:tRNA (guanine-N7-)-methyltransferase
MAISSKEHRPAAGSELRHRPVRSFVLRGGRVTDGQKRALGELWPKYGVPEGEVPLELEKVFGNSRPVIVEIGFGNGEATWRMARSHPDENFLGIEVHRAGVGRLLLALEQRSIENVRVACADAVDFLRLRVPPDSLAGVRIYFPDPWPKKRHHKRRLVQPEFVALLASRMKEGAILHLATDWAPYAEHMLDVLNASHEFENRAAQGHDAPRPEWRPRTKYERRGERLGHRVFDLVFRRRPPSGNE